MRPPTLDPSGKNQSKPAIAPDQREAYDPETSRGYLERVLGEERITPTEDGPKNTKLLTPGARVTRRRALLTQRILARLAGGESVIDIADELGVATSTITAHIARHRRAVETGEIDQRLDEIAVPLASDNLIHGLLAGDKDYTLETLKGRGKFRRHTDDGLGKHTDLPVLRISIDVTGGGTPGNGASPLAALPVPTADQTISGGRIVGAIRLPALPDPTQEPAAPRTEVVDAVQVTGTPRTPA